MKKLFILILLMGSCGYSFAQSYAGLTGSVEPQYLIDKPTAGLIGRHNLGVDFEFYRYGGILVQTTFGVFNFVDIGLSSWLKSFSGMRCLTELLIFLFMGSIIICILRV